MRLILTALRHIKNFLPESAFLVPTKGGLVQWPYLFRIEHTCQYKQII